MFTIQYEAANGTHLTQNFDSVSKDRLTRHLASYTRPIIAVYEQANPITKAMQKRVADWPGTKTRHAVAFSISATHPA